MVEGWPSPHLPTAGADPLFAVGFRWQDRAMRRWFSGLACLAIVAGAAACGGSSRAACGGGGTQPRPEVGGEILYTCYESSSQPGGLFLLNASSGQVQRLTSDHAWNVDASWSPDGRQIVYQSTREGRSDVYVMNVSTKEVRRLSDGRGFNGYPSWSPDGMWIAYESSRDGIEGNQDPPGYYREIYLVREDGTDLHRLLATHASQSGAAWSPAGDQIAFASHMGGAFDLYTVAPDGTGLRQLTNHEGSGGFATYPRWSADGSRIAFSAASSRSNHAEIYWMLAAGGEAHQVTDHPAADWDGWPDWSPDSRWIVFTRKQHGLQLFVTSPKGDSIVQLTYGAGDKDQPRWRPA